MAKIVTFGEMLLRLASESTSPLQIGNPLTSCFGGAEANVAISLRNLGHETRFVSAFPDNKIGQNAKRFLESYGVCTKFIETVEDSRMGIYFVETGSGNRGTNVIYDRKHSAISVLAKTSYPLEDLFKDVDVLFFSGITLALSEDLRDLAFEMVEVAKSLGVKIAYDNNYRMRLWESREAAFEVTKKILPFVDILSVGILDIRVIFGDESLDDLEASYQKLVASYPNIQTIFSTNRKTYSQEEFELQGNIFIDGKLTQTPFYAIHNTVDRIGTGDAYTAGILDGIFHEKTPSEIVEFAVANAILKHSVYGDITPFTKADVLAFQQSSNANGIVR